MRNDATERRVQFDFEIEFSNGGGIQGQDFRLDIDGEDIDDQVLSDRIVKDLRPLMVREVRILNKRILEEPHKRAHGGPSRQEVRPAAGMVDLSHTVEDGMITYRGLPAPLICDFLGREASRRSYSADTSFHIGRIEMVANTGTYLDSPFHRFERGKDVSALEQSSVAGLDVLVVRVEGMTGRAIDREVFLPFNVKAKAILVHTGWARHWRTDRYFEGHPFLTASAASLLPQCPSR